MQEFIKTNSPSMSSSSNNSSLPDHEKLFDEICGKLNELSTRTDSYNSADRLEKMQSHLKKSQEELKSAQLDIHEKIKSLDNLGLTQTDLGRDVKKISEQLDQERMASSKLSTDLAKSLELNLKLQFEIEEVRSKMTQLLNEEKKHNQYLADKNKGLNHELDLSQALCNETKIELGKAKDRIQSLQGTIEEHVHNVDQRDQLIRQLKTEMEIRAEEIKNLTDSLVEFEVHSRSQADVLKQLTEVAEKKMIELKVALDKKGLESQDYYSHLQQAMSQVAVLRQENSALKDYINKLSSLHQNMQGAAAASNRPATV